MPSQNQKHAACNWCTFSPFCIKNEDGPLLVKQENLVVKQRHYLKRKEVLCFPKTKFRNLYAIQQGAIKTFHIDASGNELIRGFYFSGEILGYEAIYTGRYLFSAVALSETIVCEIPYENFVNLLHSRPELQNRILYLMSQQLSAGFYLASATAEQRLCAFLLDLSTRLSTSGILQEFLFPMSRQDIGNYLMLTPETISRILSKLQKNKLIELDQKKIHFLRRKKIKEIADGL